MLSLEQIQRLEDKVFKAVELIKALKEENSILKSELEASNFKIEELEQIISDYRNSQAEIEEGIFKAIRQLEDLDNISAEHSDSSDDSASKPEQSQEIENSISGSNMQQENIDSEENPETPETEDSGMSHYNYSRQPAKPETEDQSRGAQLDIF